MSAFAGISALVCGPLLGALIALHNGHSRLWQLILGAAIGEIVAWGAVRVWSEHAAEQAMRGGGVVIRATELGWQNHLVTFVVLMGLAVLVAGSVALVRRLV